MPPGNLRVVRLRVTKRFGSAANPRYFALTGDEQMAVYLTGSHIWNNLHDGMGAGAECAETPERLDFGDYVDFLEERGRSPQSWWLEDPPAADGRNVVITDTDHYAPGRGDALWAWKSFLRGHHPILMDYGLIGGVNPADPSAGGPVSYAAFEPARHAMGDTLRFAARMNLIEMEPRGDLSSTGYALASPGEEYLVLDASDDRDLFTMKLEPGTYTAGWFSIDGRETIEGQQTTVASPKSTTFSASSEASGPTVLYLRTSSIHLS
jgi:hypothetical protein